MSFTLVRIASGAAALTLLTLARTGALPSCRAGNRWAAAMLFVYAIAFSFAYLQLSAGTGALILFGVVQLTMTVLALWRGERPRMPDGIGMAIAFVGLVWLVLPGLEAPSPQGAVLMAVAGAAWGCYSLIGRGVDDPIGATTSNFVMALAPTVLAAVLLLPSETNASTPRGLLLAMSSGAVTSGLGYALWYTALPALDRTRAAVMQLAVPVIAALAGAALLGEAITARVVIAAIAVLGGVGLAVGVRR